MIPMLYQLSYAGRMQILAMRPGLSNPAKRMAKYKVTRTKDKARGKHESTQVGPDLTISDFLTLLSP